MSESWECALRGYSYPVCLNDFKLSNGYKPFFNAEISGNRESTMEFENRFRENAPKKLEVYFEVLFWKLYSQPRIRNTTTARVVRHVESLNMAPNLIWNKIGLFVQDPSRLNLKRIRTVMGFITKVIAVCLTFPAFHSPEHFPMVDKQTANWVNANYRKHNLGSIKSKLTPFRMNYSSLQDNDFPNYISWVSWCREMAKALTKTTGSYWRARDVEMAVFTAQRSKLQLNVI